jgi:Na+-transporting NADH:ubiquinone oxidoreductase subunit C
MASVFLRWFRDTPNEDPAKTLVVALAVAFVCALAVSLATVLLRPLYVANMERERKELVSEIVGKLPGLGDLLTGTAAGQLEVHVVDLDTGADAAGLDPATYDQRKAAADPATSVAIPAELDLAGIRRRARYATVYLIRQGDRVRLIILPVHGSGYASTLYGYLALAGDAATVAALKFYEHGETPGIGARLDDPAWLKGWQGKKAVDETGRVRLEVVKDGYAAAAPGAEFRVDAISGATRTSVGAEKMVRYWLGPHGFGPYLARVRVEGGER